MPQRDVSFFYPELGVGGAQFLFARMAAYLIGSAHFHVTIIDHEEGFMRRKLEGMQHSFVRYDPCQLTVVSWPTTLVLPLSFISFIGQSIVAQESTRLFLWDLHPYNLVEQLALSGFYKHLSGIRAGQLCALFEQTHRRKLARLVEAAVSHNGMVFMAKRNYEYNRALLGFKHKPVYLPIGVDLSLAQDVVCMKRNPGPDQTVNVGWLSRLAPEKMPALYRLIDDVRAFQADSGKDKVHLHIIGNGPELQGIKEKSQGISVTFPGQLEHIALSQYMLEHIDVGFAMGTSALEFAVRGLPAVLTSAGLPQDNLRQACAYRWLFDSEGFDVTAEETSMASSLRTFEEIIADVRNPNLAKRYGRACNAYTLANHSLASVGAQLEKQLASCSFTYRDLKNTGLTDQTLYERGLFDLKSRFKARRAPFGMRQ